MILIKGDFFAKLMIGPRERVTKELVEEKYKAIRESLARKEGRKEEIRQIERAYIYCSKERNILLRNILIDLDSKTEKKDINQMKIVERKDYEIKGHPLLRKTTRDGEGLDTPDLSIIEIEKFDLLEVIKKLPIQIKRYKIIIPSREGKFDYDFYTEEIDIAELQTNKEYRKAVLKAIEQNNMNGENNYIGRIEKGENGRYIISKSPKIKRAVEFEQRRINRTRVDKPLRRENDKQKERGSEEETER